MDVIKAADPTRLAEAQANLDKISASAKAERLNAQGNGFSAQIASIGDVQLPGNEDTVRISSKKQDTPETYRKFEAMVLRNFVQEMLPSENESVYGKGTAGDIWKSMMAEHLADAIAEGGGIGIADKLMRKANHAGERTAAAQGVIDGHVRDTASAIETRNQLDILSDLLSGDKNGEA
nr:rod-binding protein [Rhizobium sp. L1K21]